MQKKKIILKLKKHRNGISEVGKEIEIVGLGSEQNSIKPGLEGSTHHTPVLPSNMSGLGLKRP